MSCPTCRGCRAQPKEPIEIDAIRTVPLSVPGRSPFRGCEQITFNAETAEAAEKKCLRISLRALRALRSNVAFFHRLFRGDRGLTWTRPTEQKTSQRD